MSPVSSSQLKVVVKGGGNKRTATSQNPDSSSSSIETSPVMKLKDPKKVSPWKVITESQEVKSKTKKNYPKKTKHVV